jgi:hypothetical protein
MTRRRSSARSTRFGPAATQGGQATQHHGFAVNATRAVTLRDNQAAGNRLGAYRDLTARGDPPREEQLRWRPRRRGSSRRGLVTPRLAPGAQTIVTQRMAGAEPGDLVVAGFSNDLRGLQLTADVGAKNSVTLVLRNGTADPVALAPGRVKVHLLR